MTSRTLRVLLTAAVAGTLLAAAPASAAVRPAAKAPTPVLTASPDTNLRDGQTVTVTGTGYAPNHTTDLVECDVDLGCDFSHLQLQQTDANGNYTTTFAVHRILTLDSTVDCVTNQRCVLVSLDITDLSAIGEAPITFDPNAPFKPPVHFRVVPDSAAHVNVDKGVVRVTGRVYCNQPVDIFGDFVLKQSYNRQIFQSEAFPDIQCTKSGGRFSVVFRPQNGLFGAGAAKLYVNAFASTTTGFYSQFKHLVLTLTPSAS